jgi:hypothetical protein
MAWAYEFSEAGPFDVVVTIDGVMSPELIEAGRRRLLADPRFRPGMSVLVDNSDVDTSNTTADRLRAIAASAARDYANAGVEDLVMLAPESVTFGLLRMWHTFLSDELAGRAAVVSSLDEAEAWLAARRETASRKT